MGTPKKIKIGPLRFTRKSFRSFQVETDVGKPFRSS